MLDRAPLPLLSTPHTQNTRPPLRHICILVLDKHLTILTISMRFFLCDLDDCEDGIAFGEDGVHLFEGAVGGFRVEEVDDWEDEGVTIRVLGQRMQWEASWLMDMTEMYGRGLAGEVGDVHDGEDDVSLIFDTGEGDRGDHDDHEVEDLHGTLVHHSP